MKKIFLFLVILAVLFFVYLFTEYMGMMYNSFITPRQTNSVDQGLPP